MIAFDNGPANGDYVRYIDALMKRAAVLEEGSRPSSPTGADDFRSMPDTDANRTDVSQGSRRTTGFAAPVVATPSATAAAAIASALMSGQTARRGELSIRTKIAVFAALLGVLLSLVGLFWPFNIVLLGGGIALVAWAVRLLRGTRAS